MDRGASLFIGILCIGTGLLAWTGRAGDDPDSTVEVRVKPGDTLGVWFSGIQTIPSMCGS